MGSGFVHHEPLLVLQLIDGGHHLHVCHTSFHMLLQRLSSMSISLYTVGMSISYFWVTTSTATTSATNTVLRRRVGYHRLRRTPRSFFNNRETERSLP
jgi:hypothetical protein